MCGIVGYIGNRPAMPFLLEGLRRLEYRGYDSAGVARLTSAGLAVTKAAGKVAELAALLPAETQETLGIAHTRWATHGAPSEVNAHPHLDCGGKIAVVHNGIIENFQHLKRRLEDEGHRFRSETDTEVLAHLIEKHYRENLGEAVRLALQDVRGAYAVAVVVADQPNLIVAARRGSPLVMGVGLHEHFVASDIGAILPFTKDIVYLNDGELVRISREGFRAMTLDNIWVEKPVEHLAHEADKYEKGQWPHYMLKEMHEQPEVVRRAAMGRVLADDAMVRFGGLNLTMSELRAKRRVVIIGCGSASYAGMVGKYLFEEFAGIPTDVVAASEFRYKRIHVEDDALVLVVSQSGETADTLAALRELKRKGLKVYGISNVLASSIARETDGGIFINAGPEIGVASTKAFLGQLTVLTLLAFLMGRLREMSVADGRDVLRQLGQLPTIIDDILARRAELAPAVALLKDAPSAFYLGRKMTYPIALEGALKLKEIAYIHAEAYPAGEMKHGPIALLTGTFPCVVLAPKDSVREKTLSNVQEIRARSAKIIAIGTQGDAELAALSDVFFPIPEIHEMLLPLVTLIPMQMLAYETAVAKGYDVDKPRNLAKSVTVE
ncbi:glutamine--fructose-6-phosphate transaminase (isomerizing) [Patescibacteria group bacterium]|nr:MAG: glutamine--fructose-6-phosphate transaminase (isomerizing) [Patescibacteria group bacterium]